MQIRVDTSALDVLANAWKSAPEIVREEMLVAVMEADSLLLREVQDRTPVGVGGGGGLKGSIFGSEEVLADNVLGVVSTAMPYAVPVELGTKPHFPPVAALRDWVEAKLGVDPSESESVAFLVARKIAQKGTEGAFMFQRTFAETQAQIVEMFNEGVARVVNRMAQA
ncbi:MAG: hypothetical protein HYV17_08040 [Xanthomonadales bacterium]|nr:hypothetical protein [Xanthomonadales bacterium]